MDFRSVQGTAIDWHDTRLESGFSNFHFVDRHYRSHSVLRRILSIARQHDYRSLLIEDIREADCALLAEENAALRTRCPSFQGSTVHRLSFWTCPPNAASGPDDFLGYAVFKMDLLDPGRPPEGHVYEAVLPPVRSGDHNNYIRCLRNYKVQTTAGVFPVTGALYAQQNDRTFVCAHVAMRTALACLLPESDFSYSRMNQITGIDHFSRKVGEGIAGLRPDDMEAIIGDLGLHCEKIIHEPQQELNLATEYQRDLYGFIESGDPALLGFELHDPNPGPQGGSRHIVPVIGHTFNDDAWVPEAQRAYFGNALSYFSSEAWLSSYVLHDDNFGPYFCLPRHFLRKDNFRLVLGIRLHSTPVSSIEAEAVALAYFNAVVRDTPQTGIVWYDRYAVFAQSGLLILRPVLLMKEEYLSHLRSSRETLPEPEWIDQAAAALPERFWMVEASAQELFTVSRRKFGEVLIRCDAPLAKPLNADPLLALRLPGVLWLREAGNIMTRTSAQHHHTPIFSTNLQPS